MKTMHQKASSTHVDDTWSDDIASYRSRSFRCEYFYYLSITEIKIVHICRNQTHQWIHRTGKIINCFLSLSLRSSDCCCQQCAFDLLCLVISFSFASKNLKPSRLLQCSLLFVWNCQVDAVHCVAHAFIIANWCVTGFNKFSFQGWHCVSTDSNYVVTAR